MSETTSNKGQKLWVLANCVETGEEVVGKTSDELIATSDNKGIWWSCPACKGWHVSIVNNKSGNGSDITSQFNLAHELQPRQAHSGLKIEFHKGNPFVELLSPFHKYSSIGWAY